MTVRGFDGATCETGVTKALAQRLSASGPRGGRAKGAVAAAPALSTSPTGHEPRHPCWHQRAATTSAAQGWAAARGYPDVSGSRNTQAPDGGGGKPAGGI